MAYSKFQKDLKQGQKYELECLKYLEYDEYEHDKAYRKEYDLIIIKDDEKIKIEVKSDRLASKTNNMAIEYECNNKPSGISTTEADYWIYFIIHEDKEEVYKIPIEKLKKLVLNCRKVSGGDGFRSKLYLLNKDFCKKFIIYKK